MSQAGSVNDIAVMSHRFAVKWSIPARDLNCISSSDEIVSRTLRSNIYRFKNIKNLEFSYVLICGQNYKMRVECATDMPVFQEDALVLFEDVVHRVECSPTNTIGMVTFKPNFLRYISEDDKVTFHCIMSIPAQVEAEILIPEMDEYGRHIVECESIVTYTPDLYPHGYDPINQFRYSGKIPDFDVKMALSMLGEAHERHDPMLKALCAEYFMEYLTAENVAQILEQSLKSDAKFLSETCAQFLANDCKIIPR